jgi:PASTA domain
MTAFWTTLVVALLVGIVLGAGGADNSAELEAVESDLAAEIARADGLQQERDEVIADLERATARGKVPLFVGDYIENAQGSEVVERYGWDVRVTEQPSDEPVGMVLAQSVPEGRVLDQDQSIRLTVAKKRPKQWTTLFGQSGAGQTQTDEFNIPGGTKVRVLYSFGGSSNSVLELMKPGDDLGSQLLVNEIGSHEGTTRVYDAEGTHYLQLMGDSWSVQVQAFK